MIEYYRRDTPLVVLETESYSTYDSTPFDAGVNEALNLIRGNDNATG